MALDLFGPANAPGSVTTRPSESRTFSATDTFFKDCSSSLLDDGTEFHAAWFNEILGVLRSAVRGNGQTAGAVDIVTANNADDALLLKAMQHLIQRGQPIYGADTGAADAITVALTPALAEYKTGLQLLVTINNANSTSAPTINVNTLGAKAIVRVDGSALVPGDLGPGMLAELKYDGTKFRLSVSYIVFKRLSTSRDYYVNAGTGSDANDGLSTGAAFLTIQKAIDVMSTYDNNGFDVRIHVADGTYAPVTLRRLTGSGICYIIGNKANPANCVVSGAQTSFLGNQTNGTYDIGGFKCISSSGDAVVGDGGGTYILLSCMDFGTCAGPAHIVSQRGASIVLLGTTQIASPFMNISGNCPRHLYALSGGLIDIYPQPLTILNAVTFSSAFAAGARVGTIAAPTGSAYSSITNPGNASGARYSVTSNAVIDTAGSGASYFPGSTAGSVLSGGQYL